MSGKTTLAVRLVAQLKATNRPLIILDPNRDPRWPVGDGDFLTHNRDLFLQVVKNPENAGAIVVVDESGESIGKYGGDMAWLATRGRHFGYQCVFIGQRAAQIDKNVRTQCANVFIFRVGSTDADLLSAEYADDTGIIKQASNLGAGEYIACVGFKPPVKYRLTFDGA